MRCLRPDELAILGLYRKSQQPVLTQVAGAPGMRFTPVTRERGESS